MKGASFYDDLAQSYDSEKNATFYTEIASALLDLTPRETRFERIVDVGSGTGFSAAVLSKRFPDSEIVTIEPSAEMNSRAEQRVPSARSLGPGLASLEHRADFVCSSMSYHWLQPVDKRRLLKSVRGGGTLAISAAVNDERPHSSGNDLLRQVLFSCRSDHPWAAADRRSRLLLSDLSVGLKNIDTRMLRIQEPFEDAVELAATLYSRGALHALFGNAAETARDRLANRVNAPGQLEFTWLILLIMGSGL